MAKNQWSRHDLEDVGRNMAWGALRLFTEGKHNMPNVSMREFAEKFVLEDKHVKNILRENNDPTSVRKGIDQAFAEYRERREKEDAKPTGSAWWQNERRNKERGK
jgi:hypothetical protein